MKSRDPKVSILILNWNGKDDTLECLRSLSAIRYPNYEIILIDNGSSDDSAAAVKAQFPEAVVIENGKNLGYAEGNNTGIRLAFQRGAEFILILNNDTIADPEVLRELIKAAESHPSAGIFSPKIYFYDEPEKIFFAGTFWDSQEARFTGQGRGEKDDSGRYNAQREVDAALGAGMFFRREVVEAIGFLEPRFFLTYEEIDWCFRARRAGYKIIFVPQSKIWHKGSRSFQGGFDGALCQYYEARNRLLWVERNLRGKERIACFIKNMKGAYWGFLELFQPGQKNQRVIYARLLGMLHYLLRRFGPAPGEFAKSKKAIAA